MKNYLLYILLFISADILNGMDQNQEENRFSICNQIKQITPNASRTTYLGLAEKLSKNNLSTCACMTYLMQKREKKAIGLIKKNLSKTTKNLVKETLYKQQKDDASEENGIPLTIRCSSSIDSQTQAYVTEKFSGKYNTTIVSTEGLESDTPASVSRWIYSTLYREKTDFGSYSAELIVGNPEISINASFETLSPDERNAILGHEKHHLESNSYILKSLWKSSKNWDHHVVNGDHQEYNPKKYFDEKIQHKIHLKKLSRAHEAAADRIPAACNDCKLASDFVKMFRKNNTSSHLSNNKLFDKHPSDEKRLQWAQRIYNLKLAEQEIKKAEQQRIIREEVERQKLAREEIKQQNLKCQRWIEAINSFSFHW